MVEEFYPEIGRAAKEDKVAYVCQKIAFATPGDTSENRQFFFREMAPRYIAMYPGKFTQCLLAAEHAIGAIELIAQPTNQPDWTPTWDIPAAIHAGA